MNKRILLSGITVLCLYACTQVNSNGEKTITNGEDTVTSVEISTSKVDALNTLSEISDGEETKLVFKASGIEPGWFAEFYSNKLRLVLDYGKDSLILENQKFEGLDDEKGFIFKTQGDKTIEINIINKLCVDAGSGDSKDRKVVVTYKGKTYNGCGSFIK
ncbi:MAG: hypothetical protein U0W65_01940 [Bacteroidia bacterium]|nr:hypothetical protein [Bacteroidia bacterium]